MAKLQELVEATLESYGARMTTHSDGTVKGGEMLGIEVPFSLAGHTSFLKQKPEAAIQLAQELWLQLIYEVLKRYNRLTVNKTLPVRAESCCQSFLMHNPEVAQKTMHSVQTKLDTWETCLRRDILGRPLDMRTEAIIRHSLEGLENDLKENLGSAYAGRLQLDIDFANGSIGVSVARKFDEIEITQAYTAFYELWASISDDYPVALKERLAKLGEVNTFLVYSEGRVTEFTLYLPIPVEAQGLENYLREVIEDELDLLEQ